MCFAPPPPPSSPSLPSSLTSSASASSPSVSCGSSSKTGANTDKVLYTADLKRLLLRFQGFFSRVPNPEFKEEEEEAEEHQLHANTTDEQLKRKLQQQLLKDNPAP
eukprot:CAMPEP_0175165426 /NCGR_PEP_ID=MMETSP0087-20121206/27080_1 /TAXON_ID=136419 /ORGANISM="Unknown Unknown, Strain D1" /LENGTH=105 /DNA_ID=CAMNT_0016454803 /DNA_START=96 /DNA_END=409 /DNA_ORIENTATION=+